MICYNTGSESPPSLLPLANNIENIDRGLARICPPHRKFPFASHKEIGAPGDTTNRQRNMHSDRPRYFGNTRPHSDAV